MKYLGSISDSKDLVNKGYVDDSIEAGLEAGLDSRMKWLGVTTTDITTSAGRYSSTVIINNESVTAVKGNVVAYRGNNTVNFECPKFVFDGNMWSNLGNQPITYESFSGESSITTTATFTYGSYTYYKGFKGVLPSAFPHFSDSNSFRFEIESSIPTVPPTINTYNAYYDTYSSGGTTYPVVCVGSGEVAVVVAHPTYLIVITTESGTKYFTIYGQSSNNTIPSWVLYEENQNKEIIIEQELKEGSTNLVTNGVVAENINGLNEEVSELKSAYNTNSPDSTIIVSPSSPTTSQKTDGRSYYRTSEDTVSTTSTTGVTYVAVALSAIKYGVVIDYADFVGAGNKTALMLADGDTAGSTLFAYTTSVPSSISYGTVVGTKVFVLKSLVAELYPNATHILFNINTATGEYTDILWAGDKSVAESIAELDNAVEGSKIFERSNQLIDLNNPDFWNLNKTFDMTNANGQVMSDLIPVSLDTNYYFAKPSSVSKYKCKIFAYDENGNRITAYDSDYLDNSSVIRLSSTDYSAAKYVRFRCLLNSDGDPGYPNAITYDQFRSYLTWINLTTGERVTSGFVPYFVPTVDGLKSRVSALENVVFPATTLAVEGASLTETELEAAKAKVDALPRHDFTFAWQTDTHLFSSGSEANQLNLVSAANIYETDFIVNTGDLINGGYYPGTNNRIELARAVGNYKKAKCDYFQLAGNHDDNSLYKINNPSVSDENIIKYDDWFNMVVMRMNEYDIALRTDKRYFTKAFIKTIYDNTYRFIAVCLDSGDCDYSTDVGTQYVFGFKQAQLEWLINSLKYSSYNEYVMVFVHCPIDGVSTTEIVHNRDLIVGILEAFANHTTYSGASTESGWEATVSVDFSDKPYQHLVGVFQGHTHRDSLVQANNVTYVTLDNGFKESSDADGKKDAIDYAVINVSNKKCSLIRLGGGDGVDREFTFA